MEENNSLDFLSFLHAKLQSQLVGPYNRVPHDLRMIREDIDKQAIKVICTTFSQQMNSADLTSDSNVLSLELLKHCFICLSQKVDARLEKPSHLAMKLEMDIPTDHHEPSNSNNYFGTLSATYHTAYFGTILSSMNALSRYSTSNHWRKGRSAHSIYRIRFSSPI